MPTQPSHQVETRPFLLRLSAAILALIVGLTLAVPGSDAAVRCLGKKATIIGTPGNDVIVGTKDHDVIYAGGGDDRIDGVGGHDTICGGPGDDIIYGGRGSDRLFGGGGDDRIFGGRGKDQLRGGPGNDWLDGGRGSDILDGGDGDDRLFGGSGNDRLYGGPGGDYVDGGRGDDPMVSGGPGDFDVVVGNTGIDRIDGGPGEHDIASYATSTVPITVDLRTGRMEGEVTERLTGIEDVLGGSGNDTLIGNAAANRLDGGPGDDHLQAIGPGDAAFGGPGSDTCTGGFAFESSCGAAAGRGRAVAVELIAGIDNSSSLVITGTAGPDRVSVRESGGVYIAEGSGGTALVPGDLDSTNCTGVAGHVVSCTGRAGKLQASMGPGDDTLSVSGIPRSVEATIDGGPGSDDLTGGPGYDTIYAGDDRVPDRLVGGPGDDHLFGVNTAHPRRDSGAATMFGGPGNDLLVGGQPCNGDLFHGGPGANDSASFARVRNSGIYVRAEIGGRVTDPDIRNCNAGRIDSSIEKIEGSPGPDLLFGDNGNNVLLGRGGNDFLDGRGGHDRCIGGGGRDRARNCEQEFSIP